VYKVTENGHVVPALGVLATLRINGNELNIHGWERVELLEVNSSLSCALVRGVSDELITHAEDMALASDILFKLNTNTDTATKLAEKIQLLRRSHNSEGESCWERDVTDAIEHAGYKICADRLHGHDPTANLVVMLTRSGVSRLEWLHKQLKLA
jgi:hypothetical protein